MSFFGLFKPKVHEPLAIAAILAASCALHTLWIGNLLMIRVPAAADALAMYPSIGPASGLYGLTAGVYLLVFLLTAFWFRGKDCSCLRDRVYWFFVASLIVYAILTIPVISGVEIVSPRV